MLEKRPEEISLIGKIRVPIEILNKNGKLTIDEMEVVKQHPITDMY